MNPEDIPLRDLHLPDAVGLWPLAPGWWLVIGLLLLGLAWLLRRAYRSWRANAPRRLALRQLEIINQEFEHGADAIRLGKELSELLRRAMLAYAPRADVAGLSGDDWLRWLDQDLDDKPFSEGPGRILETLPYVNPQSVNDDTDVGGLLDAVRLRLRKPLPEVIA